MDYVNVYIGWDDGTSLYHYGILGQKWGRRRWQNEDGSFNDEGKVRYGRVASGNKSNSTDKYPIKKRKHVDIEKLEKYGKIGLAIAGTYMAYRYFTDYGTTGGKIVISMVEMTKEYAEDPYQDPMELAHDVLTKLDTEYFDNNYLNDFVDSHPEEWERIQQAFVSGDEKAYMDALSNVFGSKPSYYDNYFNKDGYSDDMWKDLVNDLNPGWPKDKRIANNCMLCTQALVMRMKGMDASAALSASGWHDEMLASWWQDAETIRPQASDSESFIEEILSHGNNRYGNLTVQWSGGGGHSIFYTVKDGQVHFIDGQVGREYNTEELMKSINLPLCTFTDLTDSKPNPRIVAAALKKEDRENAKLYPNWGIGMVAEIHDIGNRILRNDMSSDWATQNLDNDRRFKLNKVSSDAADRELGKYIEKLYERTLA